ncbi:MAG: MbtH family NRPS accessory protein [Synechococcales cyanobacterium RM1_1_8]|nr:MbtH family NRPS accessory protein [Synechococcales cyanobacterium RM1_1_8]
MTYSQTTESLYRVVISDEGRYSIWPEHKDIPWGWRADQKVGTKQDCLDYIKAVWTDMRPLSLRQKMAETASDKSH